MPIFIKLHVSYMEQPVLIRVDSIVQVNETPFGTTLICTKIGKVSVTESFKEVERLLQKAFYMEREATND